MREADRLTPSNTTTPYRRLLELSAGGMGTVELTLRQDGKFKRLFALKRMRPALRDDPAARAMFVEEGRLAGLLNHPNVVGVLDVGEDEEGPFLAMEYVEGITVRDLVIRSRDTGHALPVQICCDVVAQAARGLATAHALRSHDGTPLQMVHRDVSPHNILVGFDGVVRVADFGIARATGRDHRTSTGVLKGKLGYMAPEILTFQDPDARTDLFSLGIVFYEMLAGKRLYGGDNDAERARRIMNEPPPDIGELRDDVPPAVQELLLQLLSKNPAARPESANHVAELLESCLRRFANDDDAFSLCEFVVEGFEGERSTRQKSVRNALDELELTPSPTVGATSAPDVGSPANGGRKLGAVALILLALVATWWLSIDGEPSAEIAVESPTFVSIAIHTRPSGATVSGPTIPPTTTPALIELPHDTTDVPLILELEGYESRSTTIRPTENQRLEFVLSRAAPNPAPPPNTTMVPTRVTMRRQGMRGMRRQPTESLETMTGPSLDDIWDMSP